MSQTAHSTKINRRDLLGAGAALMGAAATGLAFEPKAVAEKKPATTTAEGSGSASPNYAPPVVQVEAGQLRGFRDGIVYLAMKGSCSGCPSSTATLRHGIENLLKHYIPDVRSVEQI